MGQKKYTILSEETKLMCEIQFTIKSKMINELNGNFSIKTIKILKLTFLKYLIVLQLTILFKFSELHEIVQMMKIYQMYNIMINRYKNG